PGGWAVFAQDMLPAPRHRKANPLASEAQRAFNHQLGKLLQPAPAEGSSLPVATAEPEVPTTPAVLAPTDSEEKYHALFTSIDEGFAILELLFDAAGQPVDVVYLETNPAFAQHVGADLRGHRRSELFGGEQQGLLLARYAAVASTGQPLHLEYCMHSLSDQWFQLTVTRIGGPGSRQLGALFRNITRRKRHELNLAFLADLNADFAPALSAEQVMARVSQQLGTYLQLSRCHLAEVDVPTDSFVVTFDWHATAAQFPSILGPHPIDQYLTLAGRHHFAAGLPLVLTGQEPNPLISARSGTLATLGFGSSVDIPLLLDGQWRFLLSVARPGPGPWRPDEIDLLQQLAARLHLRLVRAQAETALQQAHDQLADVLEHTHDAFYALDAELHFRYVNYRAAQLWNQPVGALTGAVYWEAFPQVIGSEVYHRHQEVLRTRQPAHFETLSPILGIWIEMSIYPGQQGGLSVFFRDISARRQAEERQAFLLQLSDALRTVADPVAIQETVTHLARQHFGADRCYYYEIEGELAIIRRDASAEGLPPVAGAYRLADFALLRAAIAVGHPFAVHDTRTDASVDASLRELCEQLHIRSHLSVPIIKNDLPTGVLCLAQRTPRAWTAADVTLAAEVADRT
ncbi:GAF domain-containing protein, partial [Hymenobacter agri]